MANIVSRHPNRVAINDGGGVSISNSNNVVGSGSNNKAINYDNSSQSKDTEEYSFEEESSSGSSNNNVEFEFDAATLQAYIDYIEQTQADLEKQISDLKLKYNKTLAPPSEEMKEKYKIFEPYCNNDGSFRTPIDMMGVSADNYYVEEFLMINHEDYLVNGKGVLTDELYDKVKVDFKEWINGEYTTAYNEYFYEVVGMTQEEYDIKLASLEADLLQLKSSAYALKQQKKVLPYMEISESKEYLDYVSDKENTTISINYTSNGGRGVIPAIYVDGKKVDEYNKINPLEFTLAVQNSANASVQQYSQQYFHSLIISEIEYLTEEERTMYNYLFDTKGRSEADDYLEAIKDTINQRIGQKEADDFIKSISDENGVIDYNVYTTLLSTGEGVFDGFETFGEGLNNVFFSDGVMTDTQYKQMYILQEISNLSGNYLSFASKEISDKWGEETSEEIINMIYDENGEIDLDYAKKVLTSEQYDILYSKVVQDKLNVMDDAYQLGTSFGNMLPSMAVSIVISSVATPAAGSVVANVLMGMSSAGNAINQKKIEGDNSIRAYLYGGLTGLSETTLGLLLGNIPFLNSNSTLSIKGILSEGLEELTQTYVEAGMNAALYGENVDLSTLHGEALKSFVYGAVMSGITNGGQLSINLVSNGNLVTITNLNDFMSYVSLMNNSEVNVTKTDDGSKAVVINRGSEGTSKLTEKAKKVVTKAPIFETLDGNIMTLVKGNNSNSGNVSDSNTIVSEKYSQSVIESEEEIVKKELANLHYKDSSVPQYVSEYLKSNLRKYLYKDTTVFSGLNTEIKKNGLYHFTTAADAILESGYIKASGLNTSYASPLSPTKKAFFFNGVPDVGAFATNIDSIPLKTTAVKVNATDKLVNDPKLKLRYVDDRAITYDGNFDLTGYNAEKCFFCLDIADGKLFYRQVSEQEYNTYDTTTKGSMLSEYIADKKNITMIKGDFLANVSAANQKSNLADVRNIDGHTEMEYELKEGESLRDKIGFQFFGGKSSENKDASYFYDKVETINTMSEYGELYTINVDNFESIPNDFFEKINDLSCLIFKMGGKNYSAVEVAEMKKTMVSNDNNSVSQNTTIDFYVNEILNAMNAVNNAKGKDISIYQLYEYLKTGNTSILSRAGNFRNIIANLDYNTVLECYNQINNIRHLQGTTSNSSNNESTKSTFKVIDEVVGGAAADSNNAIDFSGKSSSVNSNDILNDLIVNMGDKSARKALFYYASIGDLSYIPVDFRNQVQSISADNVNTFLESYDKNMAQSNNIHNNNGYELKEGESLRDKIGFQFFGGKSSENKNSSDVVKTNYASVSSESLNDSNYLSGEIAKANYYNSKGILYTIDVVGFNGIPSNFWSQINDPSNVRFRCEGKIYTFIEAKGLAGADPIENIVKNNNVDENTLFESIVSKIGFDEARKALWNFVYGNDASLIPVEMISDFSSISKDVIENNFLSVEAITRFANKTDYVSQQTNTINADTQNIHQSDINDESKSIFKQIDNLSNSILHTIGNSRGKIFSSKIEVAEHFNDYKQYAYFKLIDFFNTNQSYLLQSVANGNTFIAEFVNFMKVSNNERVSQISDLGIIFYANKFLSSDENSKIFAMKKQFEHSNSLLYKNVKYFSEIIDVYTKLAGPAVTAYMRKISCKFKTKINGKIVTRVFDGSNFKSVDSYIKDSFTHLKLFDIINNVKNVPDFMVSQLKKMIRYSAPLKDSITVYRGVDGLFFDGNKLDLKSIKPGTLINDSAFLSTSAVKTDISTRNDIVLEITLPKGTKAAYIESFTGVKNYSQQEILLDNNTTMRITSMPEVINGRIYLKAEVVKKSFFSRIFSNRNLINMNNISSKNENLSYYNRYVKDNANRIDIYDFIDKLRNSGMLKKYDTAFKRIHNSALYSQDVYEHNVDHIERVILYSMYMGAELGLSEREIDMLVDAAMFHDAGGRNGGVGGHEKDHGVKSAQLANQYLTSFGYNLSEIKIIEAAIEYHQYTDTKNNLESVVSKYGLNNSERTSFEKIVNILKDADAIDRTRFVGNLRTDELRNKTVADSLLKVSYQMQEIRGINLIQKMIDAGEILSSDIDNIINSGYSYYEIAYSIIRQQYLDMVKSGF